MDRFKLVSDYKLAGDQPEAVDALVKGIQSGMKEQTLAEKLAKKPEQVIELAVKGMLPKGPLGRQMIKKLYVYAGPEHKQQAQKPEVLEIKY